MTRATLSSKQLLGVKRYASILAAVWTLCVAPVFAGEAVPALGPAIGSGCEYDYPPFCIVEESGRANGFSVELLRAALQAMNRDVTFRNGHWAEVRGLLERGEIDALPLVGRTTEREATFDFTFPYMLLHGVIVVQEGTTDIHDLSDLRGRRVAVMKGDTTEEFLRQADRGFEIHTTPTFEDALRELSNGSHDAVVIQRLVALRLFQQAGITDLRIVGKLLEGFRQDACFAVTEGNREMLALLNEGLALVIADGTFSRLQRKWFAPLDLPSDRRIVIGVAADFPPYSFLDENGMATGYNVDLTRAITRIMQIDVEVKIGPFGEIRQALENGEIAAAPMFYSEERDKLVDFSSPFSIVHNAIFMRRDTPAIETEDDLRGKDIIVIRGDIMHDYVLKYGLSDNPVLALTESDALRLLASGEHDCALMSQLPGLYWAKKLELSNIVTVGPLLRPSETCYAVTEGNAALRHLLSEGLAALEKTGTHRRIHDKWLGVLVPRGVSLSTVFKYIAFAAVPLLLLLVLFIIWSRTLKRQVTLRTRELSESEERYRAVAEDTSVLICRFLPGGKITYVNEAYCKYFERTAEDLVGQTFLSLIPEADRETVMANISAMTVESPNQSHEHQVIGADGEIRWTSWTNRALFDAQGKAVAYQSIGEDISRRKQAEESLHAVSQLNESIVNSSPIGISIYDFTGNCVAANDASGKVVGATKAQVLQQNYHQIDSWKKSGLYDAALRSMQEKAKKRHEINVKTTFGKDCTLDIHLVPISLENEPHLLIMFDDITERKLSEDKIARFGRIFEDSLNEIYLFDAETLKFTQVNSAAQHNLGYTMEELIELTPLDLKPEFTTESFAKLAAPLRKGENEKIVFETVHKRKDQSLYDVEIHLQLLKYEPKALFAAIISDITERKQTEKELEAHRDHLEKLVEKRTTELKEKVMELERMNDLFVGREFRIKELRDRVKELEESKN